MADFWTGPQVSSINTARDDVNTAIATLNGILNTKTAAADQVHLSFRTLRQAVEMGREVAGFCRKSTKAKGDDWSNPT